MDMRDFNRMRKTKPVTLKVDPDFFDLFEKARKKKQEELQRTNLKLTNLTQPDFSRIMAKSNFTFSQPLRRRKKRK